MRPPADPKRTRKALRAVRKLAVADDADAGAASAALSEWERQFLEEVGARLETYGSAFRDPAKGAPDEALSRLQLGKLKEIGAKARLKRRALRARSTPAEPDE